MVVCLSNFLALIGLEVEVSKSKLLVVGDPFITEVMVANTTLLVSESIRFLGVGINSAGGFFPWQEGYMDRVNSLWHKLHDHGFGASLIPFVTAYKIFV